MKLLRNNDQNDPHQSSNMGGKSNRPKKAQNSSSMEQRRNSNSRQPRVNSSKKASGMALVTDNRELIEVAQHMPRVNLSTTNKTREVNLTLLDQKALLNT
jgi:hypothetical protein